MIDTPAHTVGNIVAGGAIVSAWAYLPPILASLASLAALIWYGVLFYDRFFKKDK